MDKEKYLQAFSRGFEKRAEECGMEKSAIVGTLANIALRLAPNVLVPWVLNKNRWQIAKAIRGGANSLAASRVGKPANMLATNGEKALRWLGRSGTVSNMAMLGAPIAFDMTLGDAYGNAVDKLTNKGEYTPQPNQPQYSQGNLNLGMANTGIQSLNRYY